MRHGSIGAIFAPMFLFFAGLHWCLGVAATTPKSWVVWGSPDATDLFWTATSCETVAISPSADAPSNSVFSDEPGNGMKSMILHSRTHEILWLQGSALFRAWMDRTNTEQLVAWNSEFLSEGGALAMHDPAEHAHSPALFVADTASAMVFAAIITRVPPRLASEVGTWKPVIAVGNNTLGSRPVIRVHEGWLYFVVDAVGLRRVRITDLLGKTDSAPIDGNDVGDSLVPALGSSIVAVDILQGFMFWLVHPPAHELSAAKLNMMSLSMADAALLENASYWFENVNTLHEYPPEDFPDALASPVWQPLAASVPVSTPGAIGEQLFLTVSAPRPRARLQRMVMEFKDGVLLLAHAPEDFCWTAGLERRGGAVIAPIALAVYTMPTMCLSVACIYLQVFGECKSTCADQNNPCQTCFMDTTDWVMKTWVPQVALFSGCVWLFPPLEAKGLLMAQIQNAKLAGKLPENFTEVIVPPQFETTTPPRPTTSPPATVPPSTSLPSTPSLTHSTLPAVTNITTTGTPSLTHSTLPAVTSITTTGLGSLTTTLALTSVVDADPNLAGSTLGISVSLGRSVAVTTTTVASMPPTTTASPSTSLDLDAHDLDFETRSNKCSGRVRDWCADQNETETLDASTLLDTLFHECQGLFSSSPPCQNTNPAQEPAGFGGMREGPDSHTDGGTVPESDNATFFNWLLPVSVLILLIALIIFVTLCRDALCCNRRYSKAGKASLVSSAPSCAGEEALPSSLRSIAVADEDDTGTVLLGDDVPDLQNSLSRWPSSKGSSKYQLQLPSEASTCDEESQSITSNRTTATCNIAGRLTHAMRRAMGKGISADDRWQWIDDVDDILQVIGADLPCDIQDCVREWLARQRLHLQLKGNLWDAIDEAFSFSTQMSSELDERMTSGLQEAEAVAISGALLNAEASPLKGTGGLAQEASLQVGDAIAKPATIPRREEARKQGALRMQDGSKEAFALSAVRAAGCKCDLENQQRRLLQNTPGLRDSTGLAQLVAFGSIVDAYRHLHRLATIFEEGFDECQRELEQYQGDSSQIGIDDESNANKDDLSNGLGLIADERGKSMGQDKMQVDMTTSRHSQRSQSFTRIRTIQDQQLSQTATRSLSTDLQNWRDESSVDDPCNKRSFFKLNLFTPAQAWDSPERDCGDGLSDSHHCSSLKSPRISSHRQNIKKYGSRGKQTCDDVCEHHGKTDELLHDVAEQGLSKLHHVLEPSGLDVGPTCDHLSSHSPSSPMHDSSTNESDMISGSNGFRQPQLLSDSRLRDGLSRGSGTGLVTNQSWMSKKFRAQHAADIEGRERGVRSDDRHDFSTCQDVIDRRTQGSIHDIDSIASGCLHPDNSSRQRGSSSIGAGDSIDKHSMQKLILFEEGERDAFSSSQGVLMNECEPEARSQHIPSGKDKALEAEEDVQSTVPQRVTREESDFSQEGVRKQDFVFTEKQESVGSPSGNSTAHLESRARATARRLSFRELMANSALDGMSRSTQLEKTPALRQRTNSASSTLSSFLAQRKNSQQALSVSRSAHSTPAGVRIGDVAALFNEKTSHQTPSSSSTSAPASQHHPQFKCADRWADQVDECTTGDVQSLSETGRDYAKHSSSANRDSRVHWQGRDSSCDALIDVARDKSSSARSQETMPSQDAALSFGRQKVGVPSATTRANVGGMWGSLAGVWQKLEKDKRIAASENFSNALSEGVLQGLPTFMQRALCDNAPVRTDDDISMSDLLVEAARKAALFKEENDRRRAAMKRRHDLLRDAMARSQSGGVVEKYLSAGTLLQDQRTLSKLDSEISDARSECQRYSLSAATSSTNEAWQELMNFWQQHEEGLHILRHNINMQGDNDVEKIIAEMFRKLIAFNDELKEERAHLLRISSQSAASQEEQILVAGHLTSLAQSVSCLQDVHADCVKDCIVLQRDSQSSGSTNTHLPWEYLLGAWRQAGQAVKDLLSDITKTCRSLSQEEWLARMSQVCMLSDPPSASRMKEQPQNTGEAIEEVFSCVSESLGMDIDTHSRNSHRRLRPSIFVSDADIQAALREARRRCNVFDENLRQQSSQARRRHRDFEVKHQNGEAIGDCCDWSCESDAMQSDNHAQAQQRRLKLGVFVSDAEKQAALREARRCAQMLEDDLDQQRSQMRRRSKALETREAGLKRLIEAHCTLECMAEDHIAGLKDSAESLEQALERDCGEVEEIEGWRQLAGLRDLEAARERTQRRLSSRALSLDEVAAAQSQCFAMQKRLARLKAEEEEVQQQRLHNRKAIRASRIAHVPDDLPEQTRDVLQRAHQQMLACSDLGNDESIASTWHLDAQQELRALRDRCKADPVKLHGEAQLSAIADIRPHHADSQYQASQVNASAMCKRLDIAIGGIEERADWIASVSKGLFEELQAAFAAKRSCGAGATAVSKEIGEEVAAIVERWRQRFGGLAVVPAAAVTQPSENARWTQAVDLIQSLAESATTTCSSGAQTFEDHRRDQHVGSEDFAACRERILKSWKNRVDAFAEEEAAETKRQHEAMQTKIIERRRKREEQKVVAKERERKRWSAQPPKDLSQVSRVEVRMRSEVLEVAAKSVLKQFDEEAEQQSRSVFRKAEARKQRLASSRSLDVAAAACNFTKSFYSPSSMTHQHASTDPFAISSTSWAWSKSRTAIDVSDDLRSDVA